MLQRKLANSLSKFAVQYRCYAHSSGPLVTEDINKMMSKARIASKEFRKLDQKQVDFIVQQTSVALKRCSFEMADMIQKEFKRGSLEDKYIKIETLVESVNNYLRNKKSVGVIAEDAATTMVEIAEPMGVIAAVTNCTGAGGIEIVKALNALKTRNVIVVAPHPSTAKSAKYVCNVIHEAAVKAGAPENCIQCMEQPTVERTNVLMKHDETNLIWATGMFYLCILY